MKTFALITCFLVLTALQNVTAQQKTELSALNTEPPTQTYTGAHGPFYNGTLSDPTIPPRNAVPVGSLKGIKRNFTDQVIEGDADTNHKMIIGDDMQTAPKTKTKAKHKNRWQPTVW